MVLVETESASNVDDLSLLCICIFINSHFVEIKTQVPHLSVFKLVL